ncbi:hypothetical protein SLEP1_g48177 [Rubroshorea leprosula]|uniref:Uncharacterized protein n=1 Tax=Rubroshorea leprosula TaxID=152421 RepID=A0AAV5LUW9_9ROSI|nr:hypothetical protein SLEP1_g48177 [Rubroshorea leprosula]
MTTYVLDFKLHKGCLLSLVLVTAIVCFTVLREEGKDMATQKGIKPYSWTEFLQMGKEYPQEIFPLQSFKSTSALLCTQVAPVEIQQMTVDDRFLSFLPLAHILDGVVEEYFFRKGASVGYYHGDLKELRVDSGVETNISRWCTPS